MFSHVVLLESSSYWDIILHLLIAVWSSAYFAGFDILRDSKSDADNIHHLNCVYKSDVVWVDNSNHFWYHLYHVSSVFFCSSFLAS